jgi:hypothetical protein
LKKLFVTIHRHDAYSAMTLLQLKQHVQSSARVSVEQHTIEKRMKAKYPTMEVHELDEGRRYLSTRIGKGFKLVILTTPISKASVWEHEQILDKKVNAHNNGKI